MSLDYFYLRISCLYLHGHGSILVEAAILHCYVSTVTQKGQTKCYQKQILFVLYDDPASIIVAMIILHITFLKIPMKLVLPRDISHF